MKKVDKGKEYRKLTQQMSKRNSVQPNGKKYSRKGKQKWKNSSNYLCQ